MEQNQQIPKFIPFSGHKKPKTAKIMEQNQQIPKFVPFSGYEKPKTAKIMEQNQRKPKICSIFECKILETLFKILKAVVNF